MPNISYIKKGCGEIILFLHGWGQKKEMMAPMIDELSGKYTCVVLDLPGFGESSFNDGKDLDDYVEKIRTFLDRQNICPQYIVGHSFGGKVGLQYYLKYKDIKKLVIIASPILKPKRNIKYYFKIYTYKLKKKMNIKNEKYASEDYKNCLDEMKNFFVKTVNTHYDKKVKEIKIPVLIIWGNKDKQVPLKKALKLHKKIPDNQLYILKGDHFAYLENIEFTKLVVQSFFRRP